MTQISENQTVIAENLFSFEDDTPTLLGSYCADCDEHFFPQQRACTKCPTETLENVELGSTGTLWSWTVQCFAPKPPYRPSTTTEQFEPYGVGYVELTCGLKVEARLLSDNPSPTGNGKPGESAATFRIGDKMQLTIVPFFHDEEGREVLSFAFRPLTETPS
ncbi:MAG: OB-fold domain-containing protein [Pseudomonadota bacterium]